MPDNPKPLTPADARAKLWRVRPLGESWELYNGESCWGYLFEFESAALNVAGILNDSDAMEAEIAKMREALAAQDAIVAGYFRAAGALNDELDRLRGAMNAALEELQSAWTSDSMKIVEALDILRAALTPKTGSAK